MVPPRRSSPLSEKETPPRGGAKEAEFYAGATPWAHASHSRPVGGQLVPGLGAAEAAAMCTCMAAHQPGVDGCPHSGSLGSGSD